MIIQDQQRVRRKLLRSQNKRNKRDLLDSIKTLRLKFLQENPEVHIGLSTFVRLKPFWVLRPTVSDRETCLYSIHENLKLKSDKLAQLKFIEKEYNVDNYVQKIVCENPRMSCYYRECNKCKDKKVLTMEAADETNGSDWKISWWTWSREEITNVHGTFTKVVRKLMTGTATELMEQFSRDLENISPHVYRIIHQFKTLRQLKQNLPESHAVLHMDYAENYNCKFNAEIQSFHFGGSRQQVILHNVMLYIGCHTQKCLSTVSACLRHDAVAVWAYLDPVLKKLRIDFPEITTLHFVSDSPSSQYRNKTYFYLFSNLLHTYGYQMGSHNYLESGHGKGAPDGIGGSLKRSADYIVAKGGNIENAYDFYSEVKKVSSIEMYYVEEAEVENMDKILDRVKLSPVRGTMKVHQILTKESGYLMFRSLSCFCRQQYGDCHCLGPQQVHYPVTSHNDVAHSPIDNPGILDNDKRNVGAWCTASYRFEDPRKLYLGQIIDVGEGEVKIQAMKIVKGTQNRFKWGVGKDETWYPNEDVMTVFPCNLEPENVGSRFVKVPDELWNLSVERFNSLNSD